MGRYSLATLYMWGIGLLYPGYKCQYFSEILYLRVSVRLVYTAKIVFCSFLDEFNLEPRNIFYESILASTTFNSAEKSAL